MDWRINNKEDNLESCYKNSLKIANEYCCKNIAFALISSGIYGYSIEKALTVAISTINDFLTNNDLDIYITLIDKTISQISKEYYNEIKKYLKE